jgi:hypothetical protein
MEGNVPSLKSQAIATAAGITCAVLVVIYTLGLQVTPCPGCNHCSAMCMAVAMCAWHTARSMQAILCSFSLNYLRPDNIWMGSSTCTLGVVTCCAACDVLSLVGLGSGTLRHSWPCKLLLFSIKPDIIIEIDHEIRHDCKPVCEQVGVTMPRTAGRALYHLRHLLLMATS